MKRHTFFLIIILLMGCCVIGAAQVSEKKKYHTPDSADLPEGSGRIILNGRLIEPPYEITADRDTLKINGIVVISRKEEKPLVIDSTTPIKTQLAYKAIDSFSVAYEEVGYDSALLLIQDFFNGYDIVDSAYIDDSGNFSIKYHGLIGPVWIWFEPPMPEGNEEIAKRHRDSLLIKEAEKLKKSVACGNLVLIHGENIRVHLKYAQKWIKEIKMVLLSSDLNREEKLRALEKIVKDNDCALDIFSNWRR
jgi:hypothetical protein